MGGGEGCGELVEDDGSTFAGLDFRRSLKPATRPLIYCTCTWGLGRTSGLDGAEASVAMRILGRLCLLPTDSSRFNRGRSPVRSARGSNVPPCNCDWVGGGFQLLRMDLRTLLLSGAVEGSDDGCSEIDGFETLADDSRTGYEDSWSK
jgi:hypothetical protein